MTDGDGMGAGRGAAAADAQYETKVVQAIRGTESRAEARWRKEGWELVGQRPGTLRTEMTFRRVKPKTLGAYLAQGYTAFRGFKPRTQKVLAGSVGGLLVILVTGGIVAATGSDEGGTNAPQATSTDAGTAPEPTTDPPSQAAAEPTGDSPPPEERSARIEETTESAAEEPRPQGPASPGDVFEFGETVVYLSHSRPEDIPIELTVSKATEFAPSQDATAYDARSPIFREGAIYKSNVYFTVTITNLSQTETYDGDFIFSDIRLSRGDDRLSSIRDDGIDGLTGVSDLPPGESVVIKDGFSFVNADVVSYELDLDGLRGGTLTWTT